MARTIYWEDFNKFEEVDNKFLPAIGEGETMATQIVTATAKLVYKWFNDGDVVDNTKFLEGWCNDLSTYGNWLYKYCKEARRVFDEYWFGGEIRTESQYTEMLYDMCLATNDIELLVEKYSVPAVDSIYKCEGPFRFVEPDWDEEEANWI